MNRFLRLVSLVAVAWLATGCRPAAPQLVRDGVGMFSAEARAAAEARLQELATEHGMWALVITELGGDPPRMLDEPMGEADARQARAVAILLSADQVVGTGFSRAIDTDDMGTLVPPDVQGMIAQGETDAALAALVTYLESWVVDPGEPTPPGVQEGPSGRPAPSS